jgi:hypothetical protein
MRFMLQVIVKPYEEAVPPEEAERVSAMMRYNEELQKAGILLALDGLDSPSKGARITYAGGKAHVKDGPFPEAKEVLGGYWVIDVRSREEAIEWAKRAPMSDEEVIEVRHVMDNGDYPEGVQERMAGFEDLGRR